MNILDVKLLLAMEYSVVLRVFCYFLAVLMQF